MSYYPGQQPPYPPQPHDPYHQQGQYPPQGGYQQPPPNFPGPPPQGYQQHPPQHQHGFQPPSQQYGSAPPPGQYPPQQQHGPPSGAPSLGYDPHMQAQGNAINDAIALRKAMKGFGTDEQALINILTKPDPLQMNLLRHTYNQHHGRDLEKDVHSETSGHFRETLLALIRGPLNQDVFLVHYAVDRVGTKEHLLNDVLVGRSNADMKAIKHAYEHKYNRSMVTDVRNDLSMKTQQLFDMIMAATRRGEGGRINPQHIDKEVNDLYSAMRGMGADQMPVCRVLTQNSDGEIRVIAQQYEQRYREPLEKKIKSEFSGHMLDVLLLALERACDRTMTDAVQLEQAMAGMGTKDEQLLNRVVRIHWDRAHTDQVKRAYHYRYQKDLLHRIRGETSGYYEKTLVACLA